MTQLELFENEPLKPLRVWLHVWTDAERERKKAITGLPRNGDGEEVMRPSACRSCGDTPNQHQDEGTRR